MPLKNSQKNSNKAEINIDSVRISIYDFQIKNIVIMLFSNCQGQQRAVSQNNLNISHSSYQTGTSVTRGGNINLVASCMQAVCGVDPNNSVSHRKYSTTHEDNSSITANTHQHLNFGEDDCRITLSRFNKEVNGRDVRYIQAKATLFDDEVDEAHDLFYLIKMPENSNNSSLQQSAKSHSQPNMQPAANRKNHQSRLFYPRKAKDGSPVQESNIYQQEGHVQNPPITGSGTTNSNEQVNTGAFNSLKLQALTTLQQLEPNGFVQQNHKNQQEEQDAGSFTFHPQATGQNGGVVLTSGTNLPNSKSLNVSNNNSVQSKTNNMIEGDYGISIAAQYYPDRCDTETQQRQGADPIAWEMLQQQSPARLIGHKSASQKQMSSVSDIKQKNSQQEQSPSQNQLLEKQQTGSLTSSQNEENEYAHPFAANQKLPRTYGDLLAKFTVAIRKDKTCTGQNVAMGQFPLSQIPDGKYCLYYFRPKTRNRMIGSKARSSSAQDKIQRVGKGQEFYIFDKNSCSHSPSKHSQQAFPERSLQTFNENGRNNIASASSSKQQNSYKHQKTSTKTSGVKQKQPAVTRSPIKSFLNRNTVTKNSATLTLHSQLKSLQKQTGHTKTKSGGFITKQLQSSQSKKENVTDKALTYFAGVKINNESSKNHSSSTQSAHKRKITPNSEGQLAVPQSAANSISASSSLYQVKQQQQFSRDNFNGEQNVTSVSQTVYIANPPETQQSLSGRVSTNVLTPPQKGDPCSFISPQQEQSLAVEGKELGGVPTFGYNSQAKGKEEDTVDMRVDQELGRKRSHQQLISSMQEIQLDSFNPDEQKKKIGDAFNLFTPIKDRPANIQSPSQQHQLQQQEESQDLEDLEDFSGLTYTMAPLFLGNPTIVKSNTKITDEQQRSIDRQNSLQYANNFQIQYGGLAGSTNFLSQLNVVDKAIDRAMNDHTPPSKRTSQNQAAAIRFEKQMSYSNNKMGSSQKSQYSSSGKHKDTDIDRMLGGRSTSNLQQQPQQPDCSVDTQEQNQDQSKSAKSAFAAAETKVRNSQIGIFSLVDEDGIFDSINQGNNRQQKDSLDFKATIQPCQQVNDIINDVILPQHNRTDTFEGKSQISYLQQLLDTRGPSDDIVGYASLNIGSNSVVIPSQATTINVLQPADSDQLMRIHLGSGLPHNQQSKHSRAIAFQDSSISPDNVETLDHLEDYSYQQPKSIEQVECQTNLDDFNSPQKSDYQELIKLAINQNNSGTNYEQLTRNAGGGKTVHTAGHYIASNSDRKQLSTVEEENPSQCSDLTSLYQQNNKHTSRLLMQSSLVQQNHSSFSKKSLNQSTQPVQTVRVPSSFYINEDESVNGSDFEMQQKRSIAIQDMDLDSGSLRLPSTVDIVAAKGRITFDSKKNEEQQVSYQDDTDAKISNFIPGNMSANSTKTNSKQTSTAAINTTNQTKESQIISGFSNLKIGDKASLQQNSDNLLLIQSSNSINIQEQKRKEAYSYHEKSSSSLLDLDQNDDFTSKTGCILAQVNKKDQQDSVEEEQLFSLQDCSYEKQNYQHFANVNVDLAYQEERSSQQPFNDSEILVKFVEKIRQNVDNHLEENPELTDQRQQSIVTLKEVSGRSSGTSTKKKTGKIGQNTPNFQQSSPTMSRIQSRVSLSSKKLSLSKKGNGSNKQSQRKQSSNKKIKVGATKSKYMSLNEMQQSESSKENWKLGLSPILQSRQQALNIYQRSRQPQQNHLTPLLNKPMNKQPLKLYQLIQKSVGSPKVVTSKKRKLELATNTSERKLAFTAITTQTLNPSSTLLLSPERFDTNFANTVSSTSQQAANQTYSPQPLLKKKDICFNSKKFNSNTQSQPNFLQLKVSQTQLIKTSVTESKHKETIPYQSQSKQVSGLFKSVSAISSTLTNVMNNNFMHQFSTNQ